MGETSPQDHEFIDWYSQPNNRRQIGAIWFKEWERDHWAKYPSEPEHLVTPEEQAKVDAYCPQIVNALEARTDRFRDVDETKLERLESDFVGMLEFQSLYNGTSGEDRTAIIRAVGTLIEGAEQHPQIAIDLVYSVLHFESPQVELIDHAEPIIKRLSRRPLATENKTLNSVIGSYKVSRSNDMLTPERAAQIYQSLRNTPSQASQQ